MPSPATQPFPMGDTPTRRTVIAGVAAAAASIPELATAAVPNETEIVPNVTHDPIFAAIAAHTEATMDMLRLTCISMTMGNADPRYAAAEAASRAASLACDEAAEALANTKPTTMQGVRALLDHVVKFDKGEFRLGGDNAGYQSEALLWPEDMVSIEAANGRPLKLPFANWVIHTLHQALAEGVA